MNLTDEAVVSVTGAFWQPDLAMFRVLLDATGTTPGDLAEIGVLYGRSAVLIGSSAAEGETFTVVDLFESPAGDDANHQENELSYPGLTRSVFEANYLAHHATLPRVVQGLSSTILEHASHGTHRFVHVDASHLHEHVRVDIESARTLLREDGVLVLDDYRAEHTPGVAAAAWQSVVTSGLRPFAVSPNKMYATWGDDQRWRETLEVWVSTSGLVHETQVVNGRPLLRVRAAQGAHRTKYAHRTMYFVPPVLWPTLARANATRRVIRRRLRPSS